MTESGKLALRAVVAAEQTTYLIDFTVVESVTHDPAKARRHSSSRMRGQREFGSFSGLKPSGIISHSRNARAKMFGNRCAEESEEGCK